MSMTNTNTTESIENIMESFLTENSKFENGNKSAGTRARKALQELVKLAKTRRVEIQEAKNAVKSK